MNETLTSAGSRLLRGWVRRPLIDLTQIRSRLEAVTELKGMLDGDSATQRPGVRSGHDQVQGHALTQIVAEMRSKGNGRKAGSSSSGGGRGGGSSGDLDTLASLVHYGKAKPSQVRGRWPMIRSSTSNPPSLTHAHAHAHSRTCTFALTPRSGRYWRRSNAIPRHCPRRSACEPKSQPRC